MDALDSLSDLGRFKRAGQKNINNKNFQFWQQDNHPIELSSNEMMMQDRVSKKFFGIF